MEALIQQSAQTGALKSHQWLITQGVCGENRLRTEARGTLIFKRLARKRTVKETKKYQKTHILEVCGITEHKEEFISKTSVIKSLHILGTKIFLLEFITGRLLLEQTVSMDHGRKKIMLWLS